MWRWFLIAILIFNGQSVLAQDHFGVPPMAGLPPGPRLVRLARTRRSRPIRTLPPGPLRADRYRTGGPTPPPAARRAGGLACRAGIVGAGGRASRTAAIGLAPSLPAAVDRTIESTWYFRQETFHWNERLGGADFVNEYGPLSTLGYQHRSGIERFRFEIFGGTEAYYEA